MFSIPFAARMWLTKWWPAVLACVVILIAVAVIYSRGVNAGKSGEVVKQVQREAEVQVEINKANETASAVRVDAERELEKQSRDLKDAEQDAASLDAIRRKRGCVILRQQGRDTSRIPACR